MNIQIKLLLVVEFLPEVDYILHGNDQNKDADIRGIPSFIPAEQWS